MHFSLILSLFQLFEVVPFVGSFALSTSIMPRTKALVYFHKLLQYFLLIISIFLFIIILFNCLSYFCLPISLFLFTSLLWLKFFSFVPLVLQVHFQGSQFIFCQKSVQSVHEFMYGFPQIRTSGYKSVHMLLKFY